MSLEVPGIQVRITSIMNKFEKSILYHVLIRIFHAILFIIFNLIVDRLHVEAMGNLSILMVSIPVFCEILIWTHALPSYTISF